MDAAVRHCGLKENSSRPAQHKNMNVETHVHIMVKNGDLELRIAKGLSTFAYKGQDKFVFRTEELVTLQLMIAAAKIELDAFYGKKNKVEAPPTSSLPIIPLTT